VRPILRGISPQAVDFAPYTDAQKFLISRLGPYCSYCERRVATNLAVEHLQPKGNALYSHLIGCWQNFLLACVNCNSTKGEKDVIYSDLFMPDRDNTFSAFSYPPDGTVVPSSSCNTAKLLAQAKATLALTGLDKKSNIAKDENGEEVYLDRVAQRKEAWYVALDSKKDIDGAPGVVSVRNAVVKVALGYGFFSIWMEVFSSDPDMRKRLIDAFDGTRGSSCFDLTTSQIISPSPNLDGLADGGKI